MLTQWRIRTPRVTVIIRESLLVIHTDPSPTPDIPNALLARHCMNYLRQMILCRADTRLEPVRSPIGHARTMSEVTHVCQDWSTVYEAAEENQREYMIKV